ncbi:MAG TPA: hypothetical protein VLM85_30920 [Polyangiaceae bacterium]|nr:hypothetical protein [Polyangiaceae bacterium]
MKRLAWVAAAGALLAACATGILAGDDASTDGGSGVDATVDASACPQWDLTKDPLHCGSCNNACEAGAVCSSGQCKIQCDTPTIKCIVDGGGSICADPTSDPNHCGSCTTSCTVVTDAGSLLPGPNNPDAGIPFDGGYDGGPGWSLGTASCDASTCGVACPQGMTACSDGICYDPQNFHDHCGNCNTACQSTEWCTQGHCCSQGTAYCGSSCVDVMNDANNCGSCGHVCPSQTPVCSAGACASAITFSQSFTQNVTATTQCTAWNTFRSTLTGTYSSITLSGSNDPTGRTCTGATANTLCQALHNNTPVSAVSCGGYTWATGTCGGGIELSADGTICVCSTPGYCTRPCINTNANWGGIATDTCSAPTQTVTVTCK